MRQHCSSIMLVCMVVVLTCHGATLFFYYVSVDGCFYKMLWFQHCSSIISVWMVGFLKCHGSNIVLLLCQCGWLLF